MTEAPSAVAGPLPILYKQIAPLEREKHRDLKIDTLAEPLAFARGAHIVPALVEEFAAAAREFPIVFLPEGESVAPAFMLGLKPGVNGFVDGKGLWTGSYLPAYIRRYPFIFGDVPGRDPILCIDEGYEGFRTGRGQRLFDDGGAPSRQLVGALEFASNFRAAAERTQAFVEALRRHDLFKTVSLDVKNPRVGEIKIDDVTIVDEAKLDALPDGALLELARAGWLKAAHAHVVSLGAVPGLKG